MDSNKTCSLCGQIMRTTKKGESEYSRYYYWHPTENEYEKWMHPGCNNFNIMRVPKTKWWELIGSNTIINLKRFEVKRTISSSILLQLHVEKQNKPTFGDVVESKYQIMVINNKYFAIIVKSRLVYIATLKKKFGNSIRYSEKWGLCWLSDKIFNNDCDIVTNWKWESLLRFPKYYDDEPESYNSAGLMIYNGSPKHPYHFAIKTYEEILKIVGENEHLPYIFLIKEMFTRDIMTNIMFFINHT
jgi:hypothetical protein